MKLEYKIILILGCMTLLLGGFSLYTLRTVFQMKQENKQWQENLNQTLNERDQQIILKTEKQFRELYPHLDSIAKANGVQHITHVHNTNYTNIADTFGIPIFLQDTTKPDYFVFEADTNCFKVQGIVDVPNRSMVFNTLRLDDEITTFYYWERGRLFGWKWTPKWGRKTNRAKSVSKCSGDIKTVDIEIQKGN